MKITMSDRNGNAVSVAGGTSFFSILGLIFITLKLTHYIDWPWWAVLLPLYGPLLLLLASVIIGLIIFGIVRLVSYQRNR